MAPTLDDFHKHVTYDPATGDMRWRKRFNNSIRADLSIGTNSKGYRSFYWNGANYLAHRVAWLLFYGAWPEGQIDHINGYRADNRIANLRDVSSSENQKNTHIDKRNQSGISGVRWRADRATWEASIRVDGRLIHIGRYPKFDDAVAARKSAELEHGFHPGHGRKHETKAAQVAAPTTNQGQAE